MCIGPMRWPQRKYQAPIRRVPKIEFGIKIENLFTIVVSLMRQHTNENSNQLLKSVGLP